MMNKLKMIVRSLRRYQQKCRIKILVRKLPVEMRPVVLYSLLEVLDIPERREKAKKVREVFERLRKGIEDPYKEKISACRTEFLDGLEQAAGNVLAPDFPMLRVSIDHGILEEKAKAKITLLSLEEQIEAIPHTKRSFLYLAVLGILFSAVANFMTLSAYLGNDWVGGNELWSTIFNGFISFLFMVFEIIGLYLFLHFTPRKYSPGLARIFGLVGTAILVLSIFFMILSRTEIGTNAMTSVQEAGKVE